MTHRFILAKVFATVAIVLLPALMTSMAGPSLRVPDCPGNQPLRVLHSQLGQILESVAAEPPGPGHAGRLYLSDVGSNKILVMDDPQHAPTPLPTEIKGPGGLVWLADEHKLLAGTGVIAPAKTLEVGIVQIDPFFPSMPITLASYLNGSNGVARAPDGSLFTSNSFGTKIDKIDSNGVVTSGWASVPSANGMQVDASGRYLYVNETFVPAAKIVRIDIADPSQVHTFLQLPPLDLVAGLDGMSSDDQGRLYANALGAVFRVSPDGNACALARDPRLVGGSMSTRGGGGRFPRNNLYVTTLLGLIIELPNAVR